MEHPTASTPPTVSPTREDRDPSFSSSQSSNPDSSTLCFESSFRLETSSTNEVAETEKHPKGKRKRTTSQDKTILEAAYNANPKPDKAARLDIVKRVSLNEKEVQIWFQNRRQNDRRKSRPLSPQEIEALRYGNAMRVLPSDSTPPSMEPVPAPASMPNAAEPSSSTDATTVDAGTAGELAQRPPTPITAKSQNVSRPPSPTVGAQPQTVVEGSVEIKVAGAMAGTPPPARVEAEREPHPYSQTSSVGYLANRWNTENSFTTPSTVERPGDDSFRYEWSSQSSSSSFINDRSSRLSSFSSSIASGADNSPSILQPPWSSSSSQVRLSLSLDGKAELIAAQPSPPRPSAPHPLDAEKLPPVRSNRSFQRSRSALPGITLPPISTLTAHLNAPFPPTLGRGRSRDVHAWESCCESDTRDELTRLAESEASGSAVAAITLMRSSSSSASLNNLIHHHQTSSPSQPSPGVLQPNPGKRNTLGTTRGSSNRKPKLSRATSSVARLQSLSTAKNAPLEGTRKGERWEEESVVEVCEETLEPEKKKRKKLGHFTLLSPSGDSDKENWSPDEDGNPDRPRPLPLAETNGSPTKGDAPAATSKNPRRVGRVLGEREAMTKRFLGAEVTAGRNHRANTAPAPGRRPQKGGDAVWAIFEDGREKAGAGVEEEGEDVKEFMRGELSPSKRPDMDCVAGLLKLSQGNWR